VVVGPGDVRRWDAHVTQSSSDPSGEATSSADGASAQHVRREAGEAAKWVGPGHTVHPMNYSIIFQIELI
jgi:hypothetical protein